MIRVNDTVSHIEFPPFNGIVMAIDEQEFMTKVCVRRLDNDTLFWGDIQNFELVNSHKEDDCNIIDAEYTIVD